MREVWSIVTHRTVARGDAASGNPRKGVLTLFTIGFRTIAIAMDLKRVMHPPIL
jgi:hypothetical protein